MHRPCHQNLLCDTGHVTFVANVLQAGGSGCGGAGGLGAGVHATFHLFQAHVPFVSVHAVDVLYEQHLGGGGGGGGGSGGMLQ